VSVSRLFVVSITAWTAIVLATLGARAALVSVPISFTESIVWLFLSFAPAAVFLLLPRGGSSSSIAQVLYNTEHADDKAARRATDGRS
jgi:hypothetical protein